MKMGIKGFSIKQGAQILTTAAIATMLAACGGGGSSSSTTTTTPTTTTTTTTPATGYSGVVASGAPVANGAGYILDATTGNTIPFITDSKGSYSVDLSGKTGPFLFHVIGINTAGVPVDMYSLSSTGDFGTTVNVTPLTNVVLGYAAGAKTQALELACTSNVAGCPTLLNGVVSNMASADAAIIAAIPASVRNQFGMTTSGFSAISTPFTADHAGVDGLLDTLVITDAAASGAGNYQVSLAGSTPTTLVSVPTSGTAGTQAATAPTGGTAPSAAALSQAQSIAQAMGEIDTFLANFSALFATATPTTAQVSPYIDAAWLFDGEGRATFLANIAANLSVGSKLTGGGLAPYSGAALAAGATTPAANVTFDANNCVTQLWGQVVINGRPMGKMTLFKHAVPAGNAAGVCTGGTWTWAGNQRNYGSALKGYYNNRQSFGRLGFNADTQAAGITAWATATISGPGLATWANPNAASGTITMIPNTVLPGVIVGLGGVPGANVLDQCPALGTIGNTTPCVNINAVKDSDYTVTFMDANGAVLETQMMRLNFDLAARPTHLYPVINAVTATSSLTAAGGNWTISYTLPNGAMNPQCTVALDPSIGGGTLWSNSANLSSTSTSHTFSTGALASAPSGGSATISTEVAGFFMSATTTF